MRQKTLTPHSLIRKYAFLLSFFLVQYTCLSQDYFVRQFTTFHGLKSNNAYRILEDQYGRKLVLTDKGLNIINGNKIGEAKGKNNYSLLGFQQKKNLTYLISYSNAILKLLPNDSIVPFTHDSLILNSFNAMRMRGFALLDSAIIFNNDGNFLRMIKGGRIQNLYQTRTIPGKVYINIFFEPKHHNQISLYSTKPAPNILGFKTLNVETDLKTIPTHRYPVRTCSLNSKLYISALNQIYIKNGFDPTSKFITLDTKELITSLSSGNGKIYIGTNKGKIYEVNPTDGKRIEIMNLGKVSITHILASPKSRVIWVSTEGKGIFQIHTDIQRDTNTFQAPMRRDPDSLENYNYISGFYYGVDYKRKKDNFTLGKLERFDNREALKGSKMVYRFFLKKDTNLFIAAVVWLIQIGKVEGNWDVSTQFYAGKARFLSGAILDSNYCLIGTTKGLYRFDYSNHSDSFTKVTKVIDPYGYDETPRMEPVPSVLDNSRINTLCKLNSNFIFIGTNGQGIYSYQTQSHKIRKVCILEDAYIKEMKPLGPNHLVLASSDHIYSCEVKPNGTLRMLKSIYIEDINYVDVENDSIVIYKDNIRYRTDSKSILKTVPLEVSSSKTLYSFEWANPSKRVLWNCSTFDMDWKMKTYRFRLIEGKDTQTFLTSNPEFNFKGFKPGNYTCLIDLNPKVAAKSNILTLTVGLLPKWYMSRSFKILYFISSLIVIILIITGIFGLYKRKYTRESQLAQLELAAVRNILKPHYLHNTLNTLQSIAYFKDFERLNSYVTKLSKWLRLSLKDNDHQIIDLDKELQLACSFLELEKMKLEHELKYFVRNKTNPKHAFQVPFFILQPIVENTLKYSFLKSRDPRLTILVSGDENQLSLKVMDNGHGTPIVNPNSTGAGLNIIRKKLALYDILSQTHKKSSYQISYQKGIGSCSEIVIRMPLLKKL